MRWGLLLFCSWGAVSIVFSSLLETELILEEVCSVWFCFGHSYNREVLFHCPFSRTPVYIVFLVNFGPQKSYFKNAETMEVIFL